MRKYLLSISFLVLIALILLSCKKENNSITNSLTNGYWRFYISNPYVSSANFPPTNIYSLYHVPTNVGFYSTQGHSMKFNSNGRIIYSSQSPTEYHWLLLGQNIHVTKNLPDGRTFNEIWKIQELNDTLLNIRVRDISEPESSENYWGYKYYR